MSDEPKKRRTLEQLDDLVTSTIAAQSMMTASILRAFIEGGAITEDQIGDALARTERAAFERRTPETPALTGLIALLRRDLGLPEGTPRGAS